MHRLNFWSAIVFEQQEIGIPCPKCGEKTEKSIAWIRSNNNFVCDGCGSAINVEADKLLAGIKKAEQAVTNFRKSLGKLGKRR